MPSQGEVETEQLRALEQAERKNLPGGSLLQQPGQPGRCARQGTEAALGSCGGAEFFKLGDSKREEASQAGIGGARHEGAGCVNTVVIRG